LVLAFCAALIGRPFAAETTPAAALEEVLVTGERPGPGMWRVSKGNHDLWILATLEPLPKNMTWRSQSVEARIADSQLVLAPPRVDAHVGFFRGLTLLPSALRARRAPDGRTLEQTLPHDLYMRWLGLRVKYLGAGSDDENMRPMLAAFDVYTHALDRSGLSIDDAVWLEVERTAHRHHVRIVPVTLELHIDDPKGAIRELGQIPLEAEIECLRTVIERLETDLQPMRQRANMWSVGDIDGLRALTYPDEQIACLDALFSVPKLRDQVKQARAEVMETWLAAAERALDDNRSSFAVLPIVEFLGPDGWLAKLRAKGYLIEEPS
jgi:hypothetical protein